MRMGVERKSLAGQVADALRALIVNGEYEQGKPLRQDDVAMRLGVSRIPVREAFQQLEGEGLIVNIPYKGAIVSRLSAEEMEEYFDVRTVLEVDLLRRALGRIEPASFERARAAARQMSVETQHARWGALNWRLHSELYHAAQRPITLEMVKKIHDNLDRYVRIHLSLSDENRNRAAEEHLELIRLCEENKKAEAVRFLQAHIRHAADDLLSFIESSDRAA